VSIVDSEFPDDLRDQFASLLDEPHRALFEILIELHADL
jgi:hypothetical protein